ncbi:NosD domain-containing protein [Kocuria cellulosilytica]|uniref:NosD domain-containing protein n=1 Tax=Kocuria cellulosilytica TaxID=3071451 RepID=UPI0034D5E294
MNDRPASSSRKKGTRPRRFFFALVPASLVALVALGTGAAPAADAPPAKTVTVNCDAGQTIGKALDRVRSGATLTVSGTCRESVFIPRELTGVTFDGQGSATLQGPPADAPATSPDAFTVFVEGTDITVKGFTIIGGSHGIHLSGPASVVINDNVIRETAGAIHLDKGSIGQVFGNTIEDNQGIGINLQENSYARVGFRIPTQPQTAPNTIRDNEGAGIVVGRWSSAWIVGNTIAGNDGDGVLVDRNSQADVVGNRIDGNTGDGISARYNSGVNLISEDTPRAEGPNATDPTAPNAGVGIRCEIDGYVAGPQGTLIGAAGPRHVDDSCVDRLVPGEDSP